MKVSIPGMETVQSDHFLCLEKASFFLVSAQKDCITSLCCLTSLRYLPSLGLGRQLLRSVRQLLRSVRQLSFFSTTAENETFPRQMKQVFTSVPSLGLTFLGRGNIYYFLHIAIANDFMYGVSPRHTHRENRVIVSIANYKLSFCANYDQYFA